jgi:transcriptional regulator with XRE-family HTH domain
LRQFRESLGIPQTEFARRAGVNWRAYSNYELGRAKVTYALASVLGMTFDLNLLWLAEGVGRMTGFVALPEAITSRIEEKASFWWVYNDILKPHVESYSQVVKDVEGLNADLLSLARGETPLPPGHSKGKLRGFFILQKEWLPAQRLRAAHLRALGEKLSQSADDIDFAVKESEQFHRTHRENPSAPPGDVKGGRKKVLTDAASGFSVADVKAQLPSLLERLRKATAETGKKSELAEFLARVTGANVPLASVSRWLAGEREPGGEITLLLLRWVEQQERKPT